MTGVSPNVYHAARLTGQLILWPKKQLLIKYKKGSAISKGVPIFYRRNIINSHSLGMILHLRCSSERFIAEVNPTHTCPRVIP